MNIGVFPGSFNPVHVGHTALARAILAAGIVEEVWLVRTPQNPWKPSATLLADTDREAMLRLAVADEPGMRVSDVEDTLPRPSYTITTLRALAEAHPADTFHLVIGGDNWAAFTQWRAWEEIAARFPLIVYPRPGCDIPVADTRRFPRLRVIAAPLLDVSSTRIRTLLARGEDASRWLHPAVAAYIRTHHLFHPQS